MRHLPKSSPLFDVTDQELELGQEAVDEVLADIAATFPGISAEEAAADVLPDVGCFIDMLEITRNDFVEKAWPEIEGMEIDEDVNLEVMDLNAKLEASSQLEEPVSVRVGIRVECEKGASFNPVKVANAIRDHVKSLLLDISTGTNEEANENQAVGDNIEVGVATSFESISQSSVPGTSSQSEGSNTASPNISSEEDLDNQNQQGNPIG